MSAPAEDRDFDFVVAGSGVTAAAMAALLVARGLTAPGRVAVVADAPASAAPVPDAEWERRVFALSRASQRLLSIGGAWQRLPPHRRFAYERMCVWEDREGTAGDEVTPSASLAFDCADIGEPDLGFIVEGRALQEACRRAAMAAGVVFIDAAITAVACDAACARLRLRDGRDLKVGLLIAADGADSPTRALLGIETAGHAYHQDALVAHIRTGRPHRNTAWQRFLPTGPLAFLPLPDGRSSIVWSVRRSEAARLRDLREGAFAHELTAASGGILGACTLTTPIASFPLKLQYALDYVRPRAVLVGDAAHTVHPLAGQGLNLGLLDCAALAQVIQESGGEGPGAARHGDSRVLRRYERWRRSENLSAATVLDGLERLFSSESPVVGRLRLAGMSAVGRVPFLKRRLVLRALGLSGDIPGFLRTDPDPLP